MGIGMLFFAIPVFINGITGINLSLAFNVITFIYLAWSIGQFFDQSKVLSYIKSGIAYALGFASFLMSTRLAELGYDVFTKYTH
jgi:hypothetical protein